MSPPARAKFSLESQEQCRDDPWRGWRGDPQASSVPQPTLVTARGFVLVIHDCFIAQDLASSVGDMLSNNAQLVMQASAGQGWRLRLVAKKAGQKDGSAAEVAVSHSCASNQALSKEKLQFAAAIASEFNLEQEVAERMRAIEPEIRALVSARVRDGRALHDARGLIDDHARLYVAATHNYKNSVPLVQTALSDHRRYSRGRYNNNGANGELLGSDGALSSDEVWDSLPISSSVMRLASSGAGNLQQRSCRL